MEVERGELRVVVEHLLEVGHQPVGIHRVAVESAAELVVHPAPREVVAGALPEAQHELPDHRLGKLRCPAQAAFGLVELAGDRLEGPEQDVVAQELHGASELAAAVQLGGELFR